MPPPLSRPLRPNEKKEWLSILEAQMELIKKWPERRRCAECQNFIKKTRVCQWNNGATVPEDFVDQDNDCEAWQHFPF